MTRTPRKLHSSDCGFMRHLSPDACYLDVRSEREFAAGSIPGSTNIPILDDDERHKVGACYQRQGREAAIRLGESLVSGEVKAQRILAWGQFAQGNPHAMICCARGGMRSEYAQRWLREIGIELERVTGGYKALRNHCLRVLETIPGRQNFIILGGRTGSGKTALLREYAQAIDLEGLANHRGSAFGATTSAQPSQATMENHLAQKLSAFTAGQSVLLEDESRAIGSRSIPLPLYKAMSQAPVVVVELDRASRAMRIFDEYVSKALDCCTLEHLHQRYEDALNRIRKRLGGLNHEKIAEEMNKAFETNSRKAHLQWIGSMLEVYYDPLYDHGLKRKEQRICFRGSPQAVRQWLNEKLIESH